LSAIAGYADLMPATRGFAKETARIQTDSALQVATERIGNLQREGTETRLQINQLRRETLRNAKWNRTEELKKELDLQTRQFLQQQLDQIGDDLRDVDAERDRLRTPSP
jgi:hypothetical protein